MSDFLSNFDKDNYDKLDKKKKNPVEQQPKQEKEETKESPKKKTTSPTPKQETYTPETTEHNDQIEIDPNYQRNKRIKLLIYIGSGAIFLLLIGFIYYFTQYVKMESFIGEPVAEARKWADENKMEIALEQEYSMEYDANQVIEQAVKQGKRVKKGSTITLTSSIGADPEAHIELPAFEEMTLSEAEAWKDENKADNLQIVTEYSEDIENGDFTRFVIRDESINEEEYKRQDNATVYFSKGEEVFKKDIKVPNFVSKTKEEVEQWAEANDIEISFKEKPSKKIETGLVSKQNIDPEEMIAKKEKMKITISLGEATEVPNFASLTMDEAMNYEGLNVTVKQQFHNNVKYGQLIAQSIEPGTEITEQDNQNITVTYSEGKPYLRDYRGQLEGDLPRAFYDDYQSKGASISYIVKYVDAPEVKGTVVGMSQFNEYVSMDYTVEIRVSNNKNAEPGMFDSPDDDIDIEMDEAVEMDDVEK
ncbi:PASTA domain-containing protein [Gracilibacillus sp. S3-1-1]|uniref:PASTA domain-containing protein n=1 Tax=Gracilibacillus pellucidus TaxID=3095368 RepID=A0ACC6M4B8_9BACI|nr:PASTA domain-containing protein [Gracilibacillus sp. S3-1-1]MDX8045751.1 PASTA domain-containing protein [Gracilibacillus sp. S3-1-1]